jgi:hypothetical protein
MSDPEDEMPDKQKSDSIPSKSYKAPKPSKPKMKSLE